MNQSLLDVSAKAFQKHLEDEAKYRNHEDSGDVGLEIKVVHPAPSILSRLVALFGRTKQAQSRIVSSNLKNKTV